MWDKFCGLIFNCRNSSYEKYMESLGQKSKARLSLSHNTLCHWWKDTTSPVEKWKLSLLGKNMENMETFGDTKQKITQPLTDSYRFAVLLRVTAFKKMVLWIEGSPMHCSPNCSPRLPILETLTTSLLDIRWESLRQASPAHYWEFTDILGQEVEPSPRSSFRGPWPFGVQKCRWQCRRVFSVFVLVYIFQMCYSVY